MDTIKNSELAEYQETSVYVDRAIQYIITSDGLQDNLPSEFQEMMLYLYQIRDVYNLMARPEQIGDHARHIIMTILEGSASLKEAAKAYKYVEILDLAVEWIVTSNGLQENMPSDFDLIMQQLFKLKRLFQSVINSVRSLDINKIEYPVLMAAEPEPEYGVDASVSNLPIYTLELSRSKEAKMPVNFLILQNWPEEIAKEQMISLMQQLDGFDKSYYIGTGLLEWNSMKKLWDQNVIFIESTSGKLLTRLLCDMLSNNLVILTTDLSNDQLSNILEDYNSTVETLSIPHRFVVSFIN